MSHARKERHFCASPQETEALARRVGSALRGGEIILLEGPLGAGKTCFTRGLASGAGFDPEDISSPTFALMHVVSGREHPSRTLVHVDAYRLRDPAELDDLGWDAWLGHPCAITVIEWASRLSGALGEHERLITVTLEHAMRSGRPGRWIQIEGPAGF